VAESTAVAESMALAESASVAFHGMMVTKGNTMSTSLPMEKRRSKISACPGAPGGGCP